MTEFLVFCLSPTVTSKVGERFSSPFIACMIQNSFLPFKEMHSEGILDCGQTREKCTKLIQHFLLIQNSFWGMYSVILKMGYSITMSMCFIHGHLAQI